MGFERVFKDARDGQLYRLKEFLDNKSKNEVEFLVSANTNGATPLIIACVNGHLDVALYLIENCQADVEQEFLGHKSKNEVALLVSSYTNGATPLVIACRNGHLEVALYLIKNCRASIDQGGSVTIDNEVTEGASPLWCAASAGHVNLVKILVKFQASVNSTTKTNSTPLRAACFGGHFEVIKYLIKHGADFEIANRINHTCLMIACFKSHYDISKYLVKSGADVNRKSAFGSTALHECAESGSLSIAVLLLQNGAKFDHDCYGISPLLSAAANGNECIVEYFIENFEFPKEEKVIALKLLGAALIIKKKGINIALYHWKKAMDLQHEDCICLLEKNTTRSSFGSYIDADEVHTYEQIEDLITDPEKMRIQALLVTENILGPHHTDTIYYIKSEGATYANNGNIEMCIKLWMYALDIQQKVLEPLSPLTQNNLLGFIDLFCSPKGYSVTFQNILHVFERALKEIKTVMDLSRKQREGLKDTIDFKRLLVIAMLLVGIMCKSDLYKQENLKLKEAVYKLIHLNPIAQNGFTLLHLVCRKNSISHGQYNISSIPSSEVVDLLLEVGASPNAVDVDNNTPLHISAMNTPCVETIFKSLLKHGAHLDLCNNKRQTPLSLVQDNCLLDICPLQYTNLQCLSAQVVRTHNIPYKGFVPKNVETFVDGH